MEHFYRPEIICNVMTSLKCLAEIHVKLCEIRIEGIYAKTTWRNICLATLRTCSAHSLQDASFQLLEGIIKVLLFFAPYPNFYILESGFCS